MTNVMKILEMDPADHGQDLASRIVDNDTRMFNVLKSARLNQYLSLQDVADKMGVSTTYVEHLESRPTEVSFSTFRRYLHAINTEVKFEVEPYEVLWGHK